MNQYYLMAQLPSLDAVGDNTPLPITEERFYELCNRFLGKGAANVINTLTLLPKRDGKRTGNSLVDTWYKAERELRLALASVRAENLNKPYDKPSSPISAQALSAAGTAAKMTDPMEAELYLNAYRLGVLESLRPADPFSQSSVYYYGIKLKLLSRIRGFDAESGEQQYKSIYASIINDQENKQ